MKRLELFEPVAIDICDEDARMDAVIKALNNSGECVKRYDMIQSPAAFKDNEMVRNLLDAEGSAVLPIVLIDGVLVKQGGYPENREIVRWFNIEENAIGCCKKASKVCGECGGHSHD
ncbi:MAG: arsenic metallochaperone ArsD family protein [Eubacterium sp.]